MPSDRVGASNAAAGGDQDATRQNPALIYANFNPAEWGPCTDDELAGMPFMQFVSRCAMAAAVVTVAGAFFYLLEVGDE
jgi:hypothetical protein